VQDALPSPYPNDSSTLSPSSQPVPNGQTTASPTSPDATEPKPTGGNEGHVELNYTALGPHAVTRERPISFEYRGNGTNRSSSWIKRLSTLSSSSRNESPSPSSRSGSPSVSFSNGSSAPILPHVNSSPAVLPPNKLVKRTSSQCALNGSGTFHSPSSRPQFPTLRRPATRGRQLYDSSTLKSARPTPQLRLDRCSPSRRHPSATPFLVPAISVIGSRTFDGNQKTRLERDRQQNGTPPAGLVRTKQSGASLRMLINFRRFLWLRQ